MVPAQTAVGLASRLQAPLVIAVAWARVSVGVSSRIRPQDPTQRPASACSSQGDETEAAAGAGAGTGAGAGAAAAAATCGAGWPFPGSLAGAGGGVPRSVQPADRRLAASRAGRNTAGDRRRETARMVRPDHLPSEPQRRRPVLVVAVGIMLFNTLPSSVRFAKGAGRHRSCG